MIGRVIEEEGQKIVQTLAGATAGTVCKVNYGVDCNYAIPITPNEVGEGYVGVSCVCPGPYYNPATGTLTVCNLCAKSSEAENADKVMSNSLAGDTVYNMAMWCATSDGCYNSIGFSGGRSITYNPYTATLNTCCANVSCLLKATCVCIGTTESYNYPSGCFLVRTSTGLVDYDSTLTLQRENEDPSRGYVCIGGNLVTTGCGSFNCLTVTNKINGTICKAEGTSCWNQYCLDYMSGSADRPILMTSATDTNVCSQVVAGIGRSTNCSFTYNPNTGVLKRCCAEMGGYTLTLNSAAGGTTYALIDVGTANGNVVEGKIYSNAFSLLKYCGGDGIVRHSTDNYGIPAVGHIDSTSTCVWIRYGGWINPELFGQKPIKLVCSTTTAPTGITFVTSTSTASNAECATCAGSATTSVYAQCHLRCGYSSCFDFEVALENGTSNACNLAFVSTACRLRYCNTTGALRIENASGCPAGCISVDALCVGEGGITTYYDVNGHCDDSGHTQTWYIYCDGSACFNGDVEICGNVYAGTAVIGTNNINIGCYSTVCGSACSSAIGYCAKACLPGMAAIGNCAESGMCCGVAYATQIDTDAALMGRHGTVKVIIPSCNTNQDTWCGLAHIMADVINKGRCNCTWTTSSTSNIPTARFGAHGYFWNDGGSTDGCKRYSAGINSKGVIAQWGHIGIGDTACSDITICQILYSCHCSITINDIVTYCYNNTGTWSCGAVFDMIF